MKMTEKKKRHLATGSGIVLCAGLAAVISLQFAKPPVGEDKLPPGEAVTIQTAVPEDVSELLKEDKAEKEAGNTDGKDMGSVQTLQPADGRPVQTVEQEQSIQPEVKNPRQPEEEALSNPEEKPDGTKVEIKPEPADHDTYEPPADTDEWEGGNGGIPGFDYVPYGGENIAIQADDMYENGNKIGDM